MMKFSQFEYTRPNVSELKDALRVLIAEMKAATTVEAQSEIIERISKVRNSFNTKMTLSEIRASINTNDEFYQAERDFYDEVSPELEEVVTEYYEALVSSPFREQLEQRWGAQVFALAENQ